MRNHRGLSAGLVALSLAIAGFGASAAQAGPPQPAEGDFFVEGLELISMRPAGRVCLIELQAAFRFTGTLEGLFLADFFIIHLGPCDQPAEEVFVAEGTFIGEVDGEAGSFEFSFVGDIDAQGNAEGRLVMRRGTDGLEDLSGRITLLGITGVGGVYDGSVHFAP
jgi:Protein of unknown function (DUF3224)